MNKGLAAGVIIVILLVLGFGVYKTTVNTVSKGNQATIQDNAAESTTADVTSEEVSASSSLRELLASGQSQTCTFTSSDGSTNTEGTVYAASGRMRGDISSTTEGKTIASHMIVSDNQLYVWMDGEANGMKMAFDLNKIQDEETKQKTVDLDEKVEYQCRGWVGDPSLFDVPASVMFTDLSSVLVIPTTASDSLGGVIGRNESACAACDSLSGDALIQCKTALGCK